MPDGASSPISGIFIAIIIGILIRNTLGLNKIFESGIQFTFKYILRLGIILLGFRLSLIEALKLGGWGIPIILICIFLGLFITLYFTNKLNQSLRLGTLIACGTAICGVTAIMTVSPIIKAKDNEISYAVANITIFGLIGMVLYPIVARLILGYNPVSVGLFLGTAIHDTAQVTGASLIFGQMYDVLEVIDVATVTKLTRNLFIIVVIPIISYLYYKNSREEADAETMPKWYTLVPLFVIGFLFMSFLRTIGDMTLDNQGFALGFINNNVWKTTQGVVNNLSSNYLLGAAMSAVGLSTYFKMFKGLGIKPFYIGLVAAITIGLISMVIIHTFGHLIMV